MTMITIEQSSGPGIVLSLLQLGPGIVPALVELGSGIVLALVHPGSPGPGIVLVLGQG